MREIGFCRVIGVQTNHTNIVRYVVYDPQSLFSGRQLDTFATDQTFRTAAANDEYLGMNLEYIIGFMHE